MPQFMLLFVGLAAAPAAADAETQDYNRKWAEYMGGLAGSGALRGGAPFEPRGVVVGRESATDLELDRVDIGGFVLVDVESLDAAIAAAQRAPHVELGGTTIVRPCATTGEGDG